MKRINNGLFELGVNLVGGSILYFRTSDGQDVLRPYAGTEEDYQVLDGACFPLVPLCNRLENSILKSNVGDIYFLPNSSIDKNYIHGDGWLSLWDLVSSSESSIRMIYNKEENNTSPYHYQCIQDIMLSKDGLTLRLEVTNRGDKTLPFGLGFHPYFIRNRDTILQAQSSRLWINNRENIPTYCEPINDALSYTNPKKLPKTLIDNIYENWDGNASIKYPDKNLSIAITASKEISKRFQFYCPPDENYFCLEPVSHITSRAESMTYLATGESMSASMEIKSEFF